MNFRIPKEHRDALRKLAEEQGVTMTEVLTSLVKSSAQRRGLWKAA